MPRAAPVVDDDRAPIALLGGTFDPVHYGHLGLAQDARRALALPEVRMLPAGDPPHRPRPGASAEDRLAMLKLAIARRRGLVLDDRELKRQGKSYTVLTLEELRRESRRGPLVLILGADAFRGLPLWYRWQDLLSLAHIAVAARPRDPFDAALPEALVPLWSERLTTDRADLAASSAGRIFVVPTTARDISASAIRSALARGGEEAGEVRALMPRAVWDYIAAHRLYAA